MGSSNVKPIFVVCSKCGKRLIERQRNGVWRFIFGKPKGDGSNFIPVEMFIQGNIKIKCLRRTCGTWQTLNYFPNVFIDEQSDRTSESDCVGEGNLISKNEGG
jgi:hypothetical protein